MISPETLDAIRHRMDIADLVRESVPQLKKEGGRWKARCPFHQERTPSFTVNTERQRFHCFGCGVSGDAFAFVMKMENLTFSEAVEKLAARTGVPIPKRSERMGPGDQERVRIREALALAAEHYHGLLLRSSEADPARQYLKRRAVTSDTAKVFQLGFAPRRGGGLLQEAKRKGFEPALLVKAGLASSRDGSPARDFFFGRVIYPITDAKGQVVAFGGRALDDAPPKYINSPESPVFSKSRTLYGLFQGLPAIRKERRAVLVEGYMDVIACHQAGVTEAVAPLGTALTPEHVAALGRCASRVVVVFDADAAGLKAAVRNAEMLLHAGLDVRVATVPEGKDPDDLIRQSGPDAFRKCLGEAGDLVDFRTGLALRGRAGSALGPAEKAEVAREVLTMIGLCPDEVLKAEWTRRLAQRLKTDEEALLRQLHRGLTPAGKAPSKGRPPEPGLPPADQHLLGLLFRNPALAARVEESDWSSAAGKRIGKTLSSLDAAAGWPTRLTEALSAEDRPLVSALLVDEGPSLDPEAELKAMLARRRGEKRLRELEPKVQAMMDGGPVDAKVKDEYTKLLSELRGTKR